MPEVVKQGFLTAVVIPELQFVPLALRQGRDWVVHYDERPPLAIVSNIDRVVVVCGEEQVVEIFDPRNRLRNRQGRLLMQTSRIGTHDQRRIGGILTALKWIPFKSNGKRGYKSPAF
jgi:hypothetical protein